MSIQFPPGIAADAASDDSDEDNVVFVGRQFTTIPASNDLDEDADVSHGDDDCIDNEGGSDAMSSGPLNSLMENLASLPPLDISLHDRMKEERNDGNDSVAEIDGSFTRLKRVESDLIVEFEDMSEKQKFAVEEIRGKSNWGPALQYHFQGKIKMNFLMRNGKEACSLLDYAVVVNMPSLLEELLTWGFDENAVFIAAGFIACKAKESPAILEALITHGGFDINRKPWEVSELMAQMNSTRQPYIADLCREPRLELLEVCLKHQTPNKDDLDMALLIAVAHGYSECVSMLISLGKADVNTLSPNPMGVLESEKFLVSPLTFCCENIRTVSNPDGRSSMNCFARLVLLGKPSRETVDHCLKHMNKGRYVRASGSKEPRPMLEKYLKSEPFCCNKCGAIPTSVSPINLCVRCKRVAYCSRECQVADWKGKHKFECQKLSESPVTQLALVAAPKSTKGKGKKGKR